MEAFSLSRPQLRLRAPHRVRRRVRAALGYAGLAALAMPMVAVAVAGAAGPGFLSPANHSRQPGWVAGPLRLAGAQQMAPRMFLVALGVMVAGYAAVLLTHRALPARVLTAAVAGLYLVVALAPPLLSADIFSYIAYGRMGALHGINPYAAGPLAIHADPVFAFTHWRLTPSVYGPLFTLLTYALAPLGVAATLWTLKTLAVASAVGIAWLIRRTTRDVWPALVFALNPVVLVYAAGGGHNDLLMLFLATAGVALVLARRAGSGAAAVLASAAVKVSSVAVLSFAVLGAGRGARRQVLAGMVLTGSAIAAVSAVGFGTHAVGFASALAQQHDLASASSWPVTLDTYFGVDARTVLRVAALAGLGGLLLATWRGRLPWVAGSGWALLLLGVTSPWLLAWYTVWPLPFAAISRDRRLIAATLFAQALFLVHRIPEAAA